TCHFRSSANVFCNVPIFRLSRLVPCSFFTIRRPPTPTLFPYTTLFRSQAVDLVAAVERGARQLVQDACRLLRLDDHLTPVLPVEIGRATSELQSRRDIVCRLLLEKKNTCVNED